MLVDASALCALILVEPDAEEIAARMKPANRLLTSPTAVWEAVVSCSRRLGWEPMIAMAAILSYMADMRITLLPVPPEAGALAVEAYERFGKGRHAAALNFGDCFAYACARHYGVPLLYKGGDFARTDIEAA